jgi:hypothetical protein
MTNFVIAPLWRNESTTTPTESGSTNRNCAAHSSAGCEVDLVEDLVLRVLHHLLGSGCMQGADELLVGVQGALAKLVESRLEELRQRAALGDVTLDHLLQVAAVISESARQRDLLALVVPSL